MTLVSGEDERVPKDKMNASPEVRIVVRPYASALPLGCLSFAIGNALYGAFLLHLIPESEVKLLGVTLLAFVAPLESVACAMAFLSRDTGAATAMGIFAAGWVVQGVQLLRFGAGASPTTGILLGCLALCLVMIFAVTFRGKPLVGILLGFAVLRSAAAAVVEFGIKGPVAVAAAAFGLAVAACAFYCGFAFLQEDATGHINPWSGRRNDAERAMAGDFSEQMEHVVNEAGVRHQL